MGIVSVDDTGNDLGQWGAMVGDNICLRSGAIMDHETRIAHVTGQIDTYIRCQKQLLFRASTVGYFR